MFHDLTIATALFLLAASFFAGFIDSIAGGGGLIQLPALLIGLSDFKTVEVLGTNKSISIFGTTASARLYRKSVKSDPKFLIALVIPALLGSIGGASLASRLPTQYFRPVVLVLLIAVAIYTFTKPELGQVEAMKHSTKHRTLLGISIAAIIGIESSKISKYSLIFFACTLFTAAVVRNTKDCTLSQCFLLNPVSAI